MTLESAFHYDIEKSGDPSTGRVTTLTFHGKLTSDSTDHLKELVKPIIASGGRIVLDFADLSYLDSAGLGEMVGSYASVTNQGGQIKLLNVQSKVQDLLAITKLYTVFAAYSNEEEAVRSFATAATA